MSSELLTRFCHDRDRRRLEHADVAVRVAGAAVAQGGAGAGRSFLKC